MSERIKKLEALAKLSGKVLAGVTEHYTIGEDGVANVLDELRAMDTRSVAKSQVNISAIIDELEDSVKTIRKVYDIIRQDILPAKMDEEEIDNVKYEGVGKICLQGDIYASIQADSKDKAYTWLEDNGYMDLFTTTVNSSSLKSALKRRLKAGENIPEDLFKVTPFTRAQITKG